MNLPKIGTKGSIVKGFVSLSRHSLVQSLVRGFTLMEMMVVVAIIAIVASIALPAYQDYTVRAQVAEGLVLMEGLKTAMSDYYYSTGIWPFENADAGLPSPESITGNYVSRIEVGTLETMGPVGGCPGIYATFGNKASGVISGRMIELVVLSALHQNADSSLYCSGIASDNEVGAVPLAFKCYTTSVTSAEDLIPNRYLPAECRFP